MQGSAAGVHQQLGGQRVNALMLVGVTTHRPSEPGYEHPDVYVIDNVIDYVIDYVIDDWR